jgi:uncharacterized SAM-binding protein YcdF (DUF218 family)
MAHAKAIVVLAAGVRPQDNVRLESELDAASTFRCVHAANIYHGCGGCLVLVSGGHVDANTSGPPCADLMKGFLLKLGVKATDIALENQSRTTFENGVESKKILAARGLEAIVLITDAMHMPRAERCFRKQGLAVTTAACNYRATEIEYSVWDFVPSPHGADSVQQAFHEWLGLLWYWCNDRI